MENDYIIVRVVGPKGLFTEKMYRDAVKAVKLVGNGAKVEKVTEEAELLEYGSLRMPLLVINGNLASIGKVLNHQQIASFFGGCTCDECSSMYRRK